MNSEERHRDTSYVFDPESPVELARLIDLDRVITKAMNGPLSGITHLPKEGTVLDLACGPGGWVLDTAFERPDCEVAGVDISKTMIDYARARARTQRLPNASFEVMDITKALEFSAHTFDLVNARLLVGVLDRGHWTPFLAECLRILKPGGRVRLTEPINLGVSSSVAHQKIMALTYQALWRRGYGFSVDGASIGLVNVLPMLARKAGYQNVRFFASMIEYSADTPAWQDYFYDQQVWHAHAHQFFQALYPGFDRPTGQRIAGLTTPEEIERLYEQLLTFDMRSPDFCVMAHVGTIIGEKPVQGRAILSSPLHGLSRRGDE